MQAPSKLLTLVLVHIRCIAPRKVSHENQEYSSILDFHPPLNKMHHFDMDSLDRFVALIRNHGRCSLLRVEQIKYKHFDVSISAKWLTKWACTVIAVKFIHTNPALKQFFELLQVS